MIGTFTFAMFTKIPLIIFVTNVPYCLLDMNIPLRINVKFCKTHTGNFFPVTISTYFLPACTQLDRTGEK
jgi:hypothetical protein